MGKILPYIKLIKHHEYNSPLISVQLNITNKCACKCLMCKKHEWGLGEMPEEVALKLIRNFEGYNVESIVLSGGDPLTYSPLVTILREIKKMKVGLLTAGNIKFDHWNEILPKLTWARFSVDAYDTDKWMKIRGSTETGYKLMRENLDKVSQYLLSSNLTAEEIKKKVRLNFCILKDLNEDQEEKVKMLADNLGFDFMAHDTRVFEQFMKKKEHHLQLPEKCVIPYIHCVIETNGDVYPCCDIMNENADYEHVNHDYKLGSLIDYNWDFFKLWAYYKTQNKKVFFYNTRVKECETCPARYYPCNVEFEEKKDEAIFL